MKAQYFELQKKIRKAEQDMERARMKRHDMIGMKGQDGKQEHNIADRLARLESSLLNLSLILPKKEQEHLYYLPQLPKEPHQEQELVPHVPQDRQEWDLYLKQQ
jgi:hypothetical protein